MSGTTRAARSITGLLTALIALVIAWQLSKETTAMRLVLALLLTVPLWLPIRGMMRGQRRTYAWATLCVIPYFILGVTEAVANPAQRVWAAACLALALLLFIALIGYLRMTRSRDG